MAATHQHRPSESQQERNADKRRARAAARAKNIRELSRHIAQGGTRETFQRLLDDRARAAYAAWQAAL